MNSLQRSTTILVFCGALCFSCFSSPAQELPSASKDHHAVFAFVQRTGAHVRFSKSEVFQAVVEDVFAYLRSVNVALAIDELGGRRYSEDEMPLETVRKIAQDSGADSLLYVVVERPVTKWIRVRTYCYDSAGNLLWTEEAASGGGVTGGHGLRVTLDRLHERLNLHLGRTGLPLKTQEKAQKKQGQS